MTKARDNYRAKKKRSKRIYDLWSIQQWAMACEIGRQGFFAEATELNQMVQASTPFPSYVAFDRPNTSLLVVLSTQIRHTNPIYAKRINVLLHRDPAERRLMVEEYAKEGTAMLQNIRDRELSFIHAPSVAKLAAILE